MGHSMICAMEELGRAMERQHREEEKKKQTMTMEFVTTNEADLPAISGISTPLICDNLPKGDRDDI